MEMCKLFKDGKWFDQPYRDTGFFSAIRHFLICCLAGEDVVVLNAAVSVRKRSSDHFFCFLENYTTCTLMRDNYFDVPSGLEIVIGNAVNNGPSK